MRISSPFPAAPIAAPAVVLAILASALPVAALGAAPQRPTPQGNPGAWVTADDYPADARAGGAEGAVGFEIAVDAAGAPGNCAITRSSGSPSLDEATCRLIAQRARFNPARDENGKATAGSYRNTIRWVLPDDAPRALVIPRPGPWMWSRDCAPRPGVDLTTDLSVIAAATCG